MLAVEEPARALEALAQMNPGAAQDILAELPAEALAILSRMAAPEVAKQWLRNARCATASIGRLMEPAYAVFSPDMSVGESIEQLRAVVQTVHVTYGYVTDPEGKLLGLVTMRDLLFSEHEAKLGDVMLRGAFSFRASMPLSEAMKLTLNRHYPVYPVCDESGKLIGLVRGAAMFEEQAFEITAQPGSMVGVEKEERVTTSLGRAFKFRHPWLQLNLLTAFAAGGVVALFQGTVDKFVILATFLPVLAGQSGNTGCQALAVTVRGITLGDIRMGAGKLLVAKEFFLGLANGAVTGVLCGVAMYVLAMMQDSPHATLLGISVFLAMTGSCAVSGVSGALVPLVLKRLGADPATASSIIVTTATDVASMGMLLGLATILVR
ncbi:MAG: magnesium transporter [Betaproteobacteria bacterium]|nr:magnesium transporter [Betaproteobacteria bacterium]